MATTTGNVSPVLRPAKVVGVKTPKPMPKPRPVKRGK